MYSIPIKDSDFIRGNVPMTKAEIRTLILSKLELKTSDVMLDIGAGTGAVAVEAARILQTGHVTAVEKNPEAVELIRLNCSKFGINNLQIVQGIAPAVLDELPPVDKVFIGGSSGQLETILEAGFRLVKPGGWLAVVAVTLQSLAAAERFFRVNHKAEFDMIQVALSRYERSTGIMRALNPVYIFSAGKEEE